ncbi:hypothetical protein MBLNU459_g4167t1 [Dothideomycetes sp. NU459]
MAAPAALTTTTTTPARRSFDMGGSGTTRTPDSAEPSSSQNYAFLIHTAESLPAHLPPSVDNKSLARQKRRRTSPEDQAVLEAEYQRNPKPDKAARMAIVERVALGEKEVQIWFQNRRQSSRRKSRPLMPHEIAAYQSPYIPPPGASPSADADTLGSQDTSQDQVEGLDKDEEEEENADAREDVDTTSTAASAIAKADSSQHAPPTGSQNASFSFTEVPSSQPPPSSQDSNSGRMGYLANRRNGGSFRASQDDLASLMEPSSQPEPKEATKGLQRSTSLRMTWKMDGSAHLATGNSSSPSPPQKLAAAPTDAPANIPFSLQRSHSAASVQDATELGPESFSLSQSSTSSLRRKPSGRSRDSRAWAFFADKEARSELEERAEQEQSGSAADAIKHLRRSNSTRSLARSMSEKALGLGILQSASSNKRPHPPPSSSIDSPHHNPQQQPGSAKRVKTSEEGAFRQPLLPRSASTTNLPRLTNINSSNQKPKTKTPKLKQTAVFEIPSAADSDKENWSPERALAFERSMQTSPAVPPTTGGKRKAAMLGQTPRHRAMIFKTPSRVTSIVHADDDEEDEDEDDEEVAAFMGEREQDVERKSDSVSEPEDLDCVQGLLSLSQGAWR